MWCWSGRRGILTKLSLCYSIVHNGTSTSYRSVEWIALDFAGFSSLYFHRLCIFSLEGAICTSPLNEQSLVVLAIKLVLCWTIFARNRDTAVPAEWNGPTDTDLCPCGETQTMFNIVESCPLTKLNGGLSRLHSADEDAVSWLTSYGSWHAYEKKTNHCPLVLWYCWLGHLSHNIVPEIPIVCRMSCYSHTILSIFLIYFNKVYIKFLDILLI